MEGDDTATNNIHDISEQGGQENKPSTNDKKITGETSKSIKIKVKDEAGMEVLFKVKLDTPMAKIKNKFCESSEKPLTSVRFLFDGETLSDSVTPRQLEMDDEDIIEVVSAQTGGHCTHHD